MVAKNHTKEYLAGVRPARYSFCAHAEREGGVRFPDAYMCLVRFEVGVLALGRHGRRPRWVTSKKAYTKRCMPFALLLFTPQSDNRVLAGGHAGREETRDEGQDHADDD